MPPPHVPPQAQIHKHMGQSPLVVVEGLLEGGPFNRMTNGLFPSLRAKLQDLAEVDNNSKARKKSVTGNYSKNTSYTGSNRNLNYVCQPRVPTV